MPQDKLTAVRIKQQNGQYGPQIPVGAKAENVKYDNMYSVKEVLGNVKTNVGPLQEQIDNIDTEAIAGAVDEWLDEHAATTVVIDDDLVMQGAAADAKQAGKVVTVNSETDGNATKLHLNTTNDTVNIALMDDIDNLSDAIAEEFATNKTYAVGQYVFYDGNLYKFTTAHSAGAWNSSQVTQVKICDEVTDTMNDVDELKTQLSAVQNGLYELNSVIQGTFNSTGAVVTNANRIRNEGFIQVYKGQAIHFIPGTTTAQMLYGTFTTEKTYVNDSAWFTTERTIIIPNDGYIIVVFAKSDKNTAITPSDFDATFEIYTKWKVSNDELETQLAQTENALGETNNILAEYTDITAKSTANNYDLTMDGYREYNANYELKKYAVTTGALIRVSTDGRFQFQSSETTPASGDKNRVGITYDIRDSILQVPEGATFLCLSTNKTDGSCYCKSVTMISEQLAKKYTKPFVYEDVSFIETVGIYNRSDLSIFSTGDSYTGRCTKIDVLPGDIYKITCKSVNNTYPGAFGTEAGATTAYIPLFLAGTNTYTDQLVTIPAGVTSLYVNGDISNPKISIKKQRYMTEQEVNNLLLENQKTMFAKWEDGKLFFKKKSINNGKDIVVKMGNMTTGNNLFSFLSIYYLNNTGALTDSFQNDYTATLDASQTDWFAPYRVYAVNNADGDHPTSIYFTGGNHRSNNGSTEGGKTATAGEITVYIDGMTPVDGETYKCDYIDVFFNNLVNGYNTSKDDGTGRNILNEKFHLHITADKVEVEHTIIPLEDIVIVRYYGLQIYYPSSTVRFIGGNTRTPFAVGDNVKSENKTTRDSIVKGTFEIKSGIYDVDIGNFAYNNDSSYFTDGNKIYSNIIYGNSTQFEENEEYYSVGYYKFN